MKAISDDTITIIVEVHNSFFVDREPIENIAQLEDRVMAQQNKNMRKAITIRA